MPSNRVLEFTVVGLPQPKGSTKSFVITPKGGGRPRAVTTSDNPKNKGWQQTIANCAALELLRAENRDCRFVTEAVSIEIDFYLPRPQALLTRTKATLAIPHTKKPDLDKLARAAKDALKAIVWTDDSQVTDLIARKRYCAAGEFPRAIIRVREAAIEVSHGQPSLV